MVWWLVGCLVAVCVAAPFLIQCGRKTFVSWIRYRVVLATRLVSGALACCWVSGAICLFLVLPCVHEALCCFVWVGWCGVCELYSGRV